MKEIPAWIKNSENKKFYVAVTEKWAETLIQFATAYRSDPEKYPQGILAHVTPRGSKEEGKLMRLEEVQMLLSDYKAVMEKTREGYVFPSRMISMN